MPYKNPNKKFRVHFENNETIDIEEDLFKSLTSGTEIKKYQGGNNYLINMDKVVYILEVEK